MSFIYPRTVTISRPDATVGIGALSYQGLDPAEETIIFTGIPASIQSRGSTAQRAGIAGDTKASPVYIIIIPFAYCPLGSIINRDVITDDLTIRYQVAVAYWNSLGYQCECELLET